MRHTLLAKKSESALVELLQNFGLEFQSLATVLGKVAREKVSKTAKSCFHGYFFQFYGKNDTK